MQAKHRDAIVIVCTAVFRRACVPRACWGAQQQRHTALLILMAVCAVAGVTHWRCVHLTAAHKPASNQVS
jgi:hypothetical protein